MPWLAAALIFAQMFPFMGGKPRVPPLTVRVHPEAGQHEGPSFVMPIDLASPAKRIHIRKVPIMTEKDIEAILPFSSADGSLGCILLLDRSGAERVEQHTGSARDQIVVGLVNGRVAAAMRIERRITDGIITIHSGFHPEEILALQASHPTIGKEADFPKQKREALDSLAKAAKQAEQHAAEKKP